MHMYGKAYCTYKEIKSKLKIKVFQLFRLNSSLTCSGSASCPLNYNLQISETIKFSHCHVDVTEMVPIAKGNSLPLT